MKKNKIMSNKGQTGVEYILILMVAVTLAMAMTKKIRPYLLPGDGCTKDSKAVLCEFQFMFQPNYRYFTILRHK